MKFLKVKIRLENSLKIMALLNTINEIDIITKKVIKNIRLTIKQRPKLEFVFYISHSRLFLGLSENVEVAISGLKIRHPIFVIKTRNNDLVLRQLFLNTIKFSQNYKLNKIFGSITYLQT